MNPTANRETRSSESEVRLLEPGPDGRRTVRGYGLVYNKPSQVLYTPRGQPFRETILPGAADRSLAEADLRVNAHHDDRQLLGRRSAGTARFGSDETGLWYEADLPDTGYARDLAESLARRDVTGSSFVFTSLDDTWTPPDSEGVMTRELRSIHVYDMGPVVNPAYPDTTAACRSLDASASAAAAAPAPPPPAPEAPAAPDPVHYPTPEQTAKLHRLRLVGLG